MPVMSAERHGEQTGAVKIGVAQIDPAQPRTGELGVAEHATRQVETGEVALRETRALTAGLAAKERLMPDADRVEFRLREATKG